MRHDATIETRQLQQTLNDILSDLQGDNFSPLEIDGKFGPRTSEALNFAISHGTKETNKKLQTLINETGHGVLDIDGVIGTKSREGLGNLLNVVDAKGINPYNTRKTEKEIPATDKIGERHYRVKDNSVRMSAPTEKMITELSAIYNAKTGKGLVVTDGERTAQEQASALYTKLVGGDNIIALYKAKDIATDVTNTFLNGRDSGKRPELIKQQMAEVIEGYMKQGRYMSSHLRGGALDIRITDMTAADKEAFRQAVSERGNLTVIEEGIPPHFHISFKNPADENSRQVLVGQNGSRMENIDFSEINLDHVVFAKNQALSPAKTSPLTQNEGRSKNSPLV